MSTPKLPPVKTPSLPLVQYEDKVESLTKNSFFQNGRSYTVRDNNNINHDLPSPKKLLPTTDQKSGKLDKWPAQSTNNYMIPCDKPLAKPPFLLKLETYLDKELRALGCRDVKETTEERLQVHREVFGHLIDNFRTYKPLLSQIQHEYEAMLETQRETIQDLEPMKAMLVNLNDQCEQKVLNLKQEERIEIITLKKENADLHSTISIMKDEINGLQRQVEKCQEEVADVYKKYRDESDSRQRIIEPIAIFVEKGAIKTLTSKFSKLLIQDINDLKYQQDEAKRAMNGGEAEEGTDEDPIMLRLALRIAREDLDKKTHKLAEVMADYGDVVPRREFEKLENQFKLEVFKNCDGPQEKVAFQDVDVKFQEMEDRFGDLKSDHETLMREHSTLVDLHKKVMEERDELMIDNERMRDSATPRPDWSKCGVYVEGGTERWYEMSKEKSTADKVDLLLSEMTGQDINMIKSGSALHIDFFEPKGTGEDIPKYLHSDERVRNRRLNKRDLCLTIKDIWFEKAKIEGTALFQSDRSRLCDYLLGYLQERFTTETMVTEWAYNIHDAFTRYNFDRYVAVFGSIVNQELDEDFYYGQLNELEELYRLFAKTDINNVDLITREQLYECLEGFYTYYIPDDLEAITVAAEEELGGFNENQVPYKDLFTEDDEGKSGAFISMLQDLAKNDRTTYLNNIDTGLDEYNSDLSPDDVRETLQKYDPHLTPKLCEEYIKVAFRDATDDDTQKLSKELVMRNLRMSCIRRT